MPEREIWLKPGLYVGALTAEELAFEGRWIIGSRVPEEHPGRTNALFYKSFVATEKKYGGGHYPWKCHTGDGIWEFVQVFEGMFLCDLMMETGLVHTVALSYPGTIDNRPELQRRWELPESVDWVWGIGILRPVRSPPVKPGAGDDYEFYVWDTHDCGDAPWQITESIPVSKPEKYWQYVEVFSGELVLGSNSQDDVHVILRSGDHVFLAPEVRLRWKVTAAPARGVVIYFTKT